MNIHLICIGALKESYLREAAAEYMKRLTPYAKVTVTELKESRLPASASAKDEETVRASEGASLLATIEKNASAAYTFALDSRGKQMPSEKFAKKFEKIALSGKSDLIFLIGGSLGLSGAVREKADEVLSFSEMTFPHQLMRVILLEQIYRAFKISRGEPYHK